MTDRPRHPQQSTEEAAAWLARLNAHAVSTETLEDFYAWRRDRAHAAAFARVEALWAQADGLAADPDIARATADALDAPFARRAGLWSRRALIAGGLAAACAGLVGIALRPVRYATARGEQRLVTLDDGSRVHINTDSQITVALTQARRAIALDRGEAWFDVAHDSARPFVVTAAGAQIRAIGTSFSVRRLDDATRVTLAEGRVLLRADADGPVLAMAPGEQRDVVNGRVGPAVHADLARALAWRQGRLSFENTPLAQAIAEVDRYTARPVRLAAPDYAAVEVNGTFEIGDVAAFVAAVTTLFPLKAERDAAGGLVLRSAAGA